MLNSYNINIINKNRNVRLKFSERKETRKQFVGEEYGDSQETEKLLGKHNSLRAIIALIG